MKLAAIDIGSNAMRLLISRVFPAEQGEVVFKKVEFIRVPLRLGDDVFTTGKISAGKKELFIMAMQAFKLIMDIHEVKNYKACATSAMREASNAPQIIKLLASRYDLNLDVISGEEESRLILRSVMETVIRQGTFMNIDVGGGSTEITFIRNGVPKESASFPIGTVRLMDGKVARQTWKDLEDWVKAGAKRYKGAKALGTGGNISKLYRMSGAQGKGQYLRIDDLEVLYDQIADMPLANRIYDLKLNPDRADVIEHAAKIYLQIMKWAKIDEIMAPSAGLKEGIILDLWERVNKEEKQQF